MAKIIENDYGRRMIRLSSDDVISTVREYLLVMKNTRDYEEIRTRLSNREIFLPEDM